MFLMENEFLVEGLAGALVLVDSMLVVILR